LRKPSQRRARRNIKQDESVTDPLKEFHANARVAVLGRRAEDFGNLPSKPAWRRIESNSAPWTDDFSDILGALLHKKLGR